MFVGFDKDLECFQGFTLTGAGLDPARKQILQTGNVQFGMCRSWCIRQRALSFAGMGNSEKQRHSPSCGLQT